MKRIAIIYFSGTDHTHQMAEAVAAGAREVAGTQVDVLRITGAQIHEGRWNEPAFLAVLDAADAMVFGTPTYMGGAAAQFKAFADRTGERWLGQEWRDKLAGGFTHGASLSGDKTATLIYLSVLAAQLGMVWINPSELGLETRGGAAAVNRMGSYLGVMGQSDLDMDNPRTPIDPGDRESCVRYGRRMAEWAHRLG